MTETGFTPGPWGAYRRSSGLLRVHTTNGKVTICGVHRLGIRNGQPPATSEEVGNLNLIAAAPDLYAALEAAHQFIQNGVEFGYVKMPDQDDPAHETLPLISAVLKQARGEQVKS